ncbi:MAG: TPMT family class I SAM-dependent methyltransferase [Acidimicrobiia bacterium]|nr:TPMT family class I SAM-dependent methyltransferase [Acidimicrobiia bacterium]
MPSSTDWSLRYAAGNTPWDMRRAHPELTRRLELDPTLGTGRVGTALVPGSGHGHDAAALAGAGWDVTAVDFALGMAPVSHHGVEFREANVFDIDGVFDLMFDHTFFCALDPSERMRFGGLARRVVRAGGHVVSIVFPIGRPLESCGPPFPMEVDHVSRVLGGEFELVAESAPFTTGRRAWPHVWAHWTRMPPSTES